MVVRFSLICTLAAGCGRINFPETAREDGGVLIADDTLRLDTGVSSVDAMPLVDCTIANPTAMFCDSFENPVREEVWDYEIVMNGTVASTQTRAFRGARALEVTTSGVDDFKAARWGVFYPMTITAGNELYLRAWYWVSSASVWADQASLLSTGNSVDPYPSTYMMFKPDDLHLNVDGTTFIFATDIPRDRWVCIQLHITVDATNGNVELTIDGGAPLVTGATDTFVGNTGYQAVDFGVHYATPAQGPVVLWIDEVVVDSSPVACN